MQAGSLEEAIVRTHKKNGGSTYSYRTKKNMAGTPFCVFSPLPKETKVVQGNRVTVEQVTSYLRQKITFFKRGYGVGTWYNSKKNESVFDVVELVPLVPKGLAECKKRARFAMQEQIYDLLNRKLIPVSIRSRSTISFQSSGFDSKGVPLSAVE